jgi:alginate O-acetyltransferase complex protein AlgI
MDRMAVKWWHGWAPLVLLPGAVLVLALPVWPRWATMWALAVAIYAGCKWLTWRRSPVEGVPLWRHAGYLLAWPGLDARTFLVERPAHRPARVEWIRGVRNLILGAVLLFGVARLVLPMTLSGAGWTGMAGLVLMLHFGTLQLLSCVWRAAGVQARPLMNDPLRSVSLGEFWGRRWNTAFRDLTHRFLYRPWIRTVGPKAAIAGGFLFSGLVHDLVISLPAAGGYGGPTLFFAAHGAGILLERSAAGETHGLARGVRGRIFVLLLLVLPLPLLFHQPFVHRIVIPFMQTLGAI